VVVVAGSGRSTGGAATSTGSPPSRTDPATTAPPRRAITTTAAPPAISSRWRRRIAVARSWTCSRTSSSVGTDGLLPAGAEAVPEGRQGARQVRLDRVGRDPQGRRHLGLGQADQVPEGDHLALAAGQAAQGEDQGHALGRGVGGVTDG